MEIKRGDVVICAAPGDYGKPRLGVVVQSDLFNGAHSSVSDSGLDDIQLWQTERRNSQMPEKPLLGSGAAFGSGRRSWGQ